MKNNLPLEIPHLLLKLDENQLRELNHIIVERLHLIQKARHLKAMINLNVGDKVRFITKYGEEIIGHVTRLNQKTVSIISSEGMPWNVSPQLLEKVEIVYGIR